MTEMIEVKTTELAGPALDWAVAEAEGIQRFVMGNDWPGNSAVDDAADRDRVVICNLIGRLVVARGGWSDEWKPSASWAQGGLLIDKHKVSIAYHNGPDCTPMACLHDTHPAFECGRTILIAACRAIVAAKLGKSVRVPRHLWLGFK